MWPLPRDRSDRRRTRRRYQGKVTFGKMDVDRNGATPMRYKVTGIPTLLVFKNEKVVEQLVGYR